MNKSPTWKLYLAAGNWANRYPTGMFRTRENEFTKSLASTARETSAGR